MTAFIDIIKDFTKLSVIKKARLHIEHRKVLLVRNNI